MRMPTLTPQQESVSQVDVFGGFNHNLRIGDGEFYDMQNLTSDRYPQMASMSPRGSHIGKHADGMIAKDALCYVSGGEFYIGDHAVAGLALTAGKKRLVSMGAYVIILPDKMWVNTIDPTQHGSIEAEWSGDSVEISMCLRDGTNQTVKYTGATPPENPENMELWIDTSSQKHTLKMWSETTSMWVAQATTYVKISAPGIGTAFSQYDGVELQISGLPDTPAYKQIKDLNGAAVLWGKDDGYIVVVGIVDQSVTLGGVDTPGFSMSVSRKMPEMDFVIEHNNRLWGCRYGLNRKQEVVNELYASKLGDFKNWSCFMGISTDSYSVSLGSDGPFTGAVTHGNYPIFFKENCLHKVYGQMPSNFQVQTTSCRGVQKGCADSLAIVNEVLYYKAKNGVCAYDGSIPAEVSSQFGELRYENANAAAHGSKYYVSMARADTGERELLVYDTGKGLWHREQDPGIEGMCSCAGVLYAALQDRIITLSGAPGTDAVEWNATTGIIGALTPENKYLQRLSIRMILGKGSRVRILAQYNSVGQWEELAELEGTDMRSFAFTVRPVRCDHLRLKFVGLGKCIVYAIAKHMAAGSDMHDRD